MQEEPKITPGEESSKKIPPMANPPGWVFGVVYYLGLCGLPFALGGVVHLAVFETPSLDRAQDQMSLALAIGLSVVTGLMVLVPGIRLWLWRPKRLAFGTAWCLFLIGAVLGLGEWVLRMGTPPWPIGGLHGVPVSDAREAWAEQDADSDDLNAWGQRDKSHSIRKPEGTLRIALIGDSFLEESTSSPLSRLVEDKLNRPDIEVLNLGVSATDPDEYFYRTKNIALALDVDHCVLCLYSGNDMTSPDRTLETKAGIVAVYPRGSMFSSVGLYAWNHLLTNQRRPVLETWFNAGNLLASETRLAEAIAEADDQGLRNLLYSLDYDQRSPAHLETLARRLNTPEMAAFFETLRSPDKGLFRSYYLSFGLWSASVGGGQWSPLSEESAYHWIRETSRVCAANGVGLTLVIIPEAFQVDPRMVEQWMPLTDMQTLTRTCRVTATKLAIRAEADGLDVVDLHEAFDGVRGTYLNFDGHWSDKGADLAAETISQRLTQALPPESP